jgi:hypothetical protein
MDCREIGCECELDSSGSGYDPVVGCCEHGNEPLDCMKGWELLVLLSR